MYFKVPEDSGTLTFSIQPTVRRDLATVGCPRCCHFAGVSCFRLTFFVSQGTLASLQAFSGKLRELGGHRQDFLGKLGR